MKKLSIVVLSLCLLGFSGAVYGAASDQAAHLRQLRASVQELLNKHIARKQTAPKALHPTIDRAIANAENMVKQYDAELKTLEG